jgi:hypothetical protein
VPKISSQIPPLACEVIQDKITLILRDELPNQATLASDPSLNAKVVKDRLTTPGHQEMPLVSVLFNRVNFESRTQVQTDGANLISILIYTSGVNSPTEKGGEKSLKNNRALARVIRGVLEAPEYKNLDFETRFIKRLYVDSYGLAEPDAEQASTFTALGRLDFSVEAIESNILQAARELEASDVVAKLYDTELGYKTTIEQE